MIVAELHALHDALTAIATELIDLQIELAQAKLRLDASDADIARLRCAVDALPPTG
jgi:hypothetical protein